MRQMTVILVLLAAATTGCKPEKPAQKSGNEARARVTEHGLKADQARKAQGQTATGGDKKGLSQADAKIVVASIGDYEITLGDVEQALERQPAFARSRYKAFDKKVEFLSNMINFELLAIEAKKKGYDTHPDVVLAMKREMIKKFSSTDLQKLVTVSRITDDEIQGYYDNNKSMFVKPAQVRASHILFADEAAAIKQLEELRASIKSDRQRARVIFSDFARRLSKDRDTAHLNGDLGFFTRDGYLDKARGDRLKLPKPLVDAAFNLPGLNRVTKAIKTEKGWHIIQVTNRRPAVNRTAADARRQITNILLRQKKDKARDDYITSLRQKATVTINEDVLKRVDVTKIGGGAHHQRKLTPQDMSNPAKVLKLPPKAPTPTPGGTP